MVKSAVGWMCAVCLGVFVASCERPAPEAKGGGQRTPRVAVVPKGTTHDFWKSVHAGAARGAKDAGFEVVFRGPEREDDREAQIALMDNLISAKYDAIVLAPLDAAALVEPVRRATRSGIPVVIIDSGLNAKAGEDFVAFVATDNYAGGRLGGQRLGRAMGGTGRALLLRYLEGSESTTSRERGFLDAMAEFPGIEVVDRRRYAGATRAAAQDAAENLLTAEPGVTGVFCPNEPTTFGMLLALRSRGLAGKVRFVGFDASEEAVAALRAGEVHGLVLQNPIRMGELGVRAVADRLGGRAVPTSIDTGVMLVTPENVDSPEVSELISPDLKGMLGG